MIRKIALAFAEAHEILEFILNQFLALTNAGNERRLSRKKKKIHSLIMCSCRPLFAHSYPCPPSQWSIELDENLNGSSRQ